MPSKYILSDSIEFVGEWHLPSVDNSQHIPGKLLWSSGRGMLHLHDSFTVLKGAIHGDEIYPYQAVHGVTTESKFVSMLNAYSAGRNMSLGQNGFRQSERIASPLIVCGAHVFPETLYSSVKLRIPGLITWLGRSGIQQSFVNKPDGAGINIVYHIEGLQDESIYIPRLASMIKFGVDRNMSGDLISEISVKSTASITIQPESPKDLDWFFEQTTKLTTLLSFLAGAPMSPDHISGKTDESNVNVEVLVSLREGGTCTHKHVHN